MDAQTLSQAAGISVVRARVWAPLLSDAIDKFDIDLEQRLPAFIAQTGHESNSYANTREIWGPTVTQRRYEGRSDLGNTQSGDGKRFMGRGLIMITGRDNYTALSKALGVDFVRNPGLVEQDQYAALSAGWWWKTHGCNEIADKRDFLALSIRINGKNPSTGLPNGWEDRTSRWIRAKDALGVV